MSHRYALSTLLLASLAVPNSAQEVFGDYYPVQVGYSWTFLNVSTGQQSLWDAQDAFPSASGVLLVGPDLSNGWVVSNDGTTFCFPGGLDAGVKAPWVTPLCIAAFSDGDAHDLEQAPGVSIDRVVLRDWSNLDPALLATVGAYGVDPSLTDVFVWVWYDKQQSPNLQNAILESGTGGVPQPYGVTDICWFQKGQGPIARRGVEAVTGALGDLELVVLTSFDCNGNQIPDHLDISSGTSQDCNSDDVPDECQVASETLRPGTPPNPLALMPGISGGPVIGQTWNPSIDHTSFQPSATLDILGISVASTPPVEIPTPIGTLLCVPPSPALTFPVTAGVAFQVSIPLDCGLIGVKACSQGASVTASGSIALTNAIDITIGAT